MSGAARRTWGVAVGLCAACVLIAVLTLERGGERVRDGGPPEARVTSPAGVRALVDGAPEPAAEVPANAADEAERVEAPAVESDESTLRPQLRVIVLDALERRPIEGAEVMPLDRASPQRRRTDPHGVCLLPLRSEAAEDRLRVEAAGYCASTVMRSRGSSVVIALTPATTLFGRVVDAASGQPVAEARIALVTDDFTPVHAVDTTSAPDGAYELAGVPLDLDAAFAVRAAGFALQRIPFALPRGKARTRQDLRLVRGEQIAGRVEDWTSGDGLAGARVSGLVADEHGEFHGPVLTLPGTRWSWIEVEAPEHAALRGWSDLERTAAHVYRLPRPAVIAGEVRSLDGLAPGAQVWFEAGEPVRVDGTIQETSPLYELPQGWGYDLRAGGSVETDAQGRYRLSVLPWSLNGRVRAAGPGREGESLLRAVGAPGFEHRVDVWMVGQPIAGTRVRGGVRVNGQVGGDAGTVAWRVGERAGFVALQGGAFDVVVPPGEVHLVATLSALPDSPSAELVVHVDEDEQRGVMLDVLAPRATISGRVRTHAGEPVPGARVEVVLSSLGVRADEQGAYVLHVTDLGRPYDLALTLGQNERYALRGIQPGARDVDFLVADGYRFFVRVVDGATGAVLHVVDSVQVLSRAGEGSFREHPPSSMARDAEGWFEFRTPQRELDLLALPRTELLPLHGTALARARFDGEQRIELVLRRAIPFLLELARDAEPWPADHELSVVEVDLPRAPVDGEVWHQLMQRRRVRFDEHGRARLHLAPGAYRFVPPETSWTILPELVRVEPGVLPLVVDWTRGE